VETLAFDRPARAQPGQFTMAAAAKGATESDPAGNMAKRISRPLRKVE